MGTISYTIPTAGSTLNSIADPELSTALQTILTWANGNIDAVNLSALLAQAAGVNQTAQTVKGAVSNVGPGTRTNTVYGALSDAPDQVTGIVVPTNGKLLVSYQATWQESVAGAARAAIFVGTNQLEIQQSLVSRGPATQAAATQSAGAARNCPLFSTTFGLGSVTPNGIYSGDVSTGQIVGFIAGGVDPNMVMEIGGTVEGLAAIQGGGPCEIFLPAGTYTVSVQFKASSGTVTASNRRLWVEAKSFS